MTREGKEAAMNGRREKRCQACGGCARLRVSVDALYGRRPHAVEDADGRADFDGIPEGCARAVRFERHERLAMVDAHGPKKTALRCSVGSGERRAGAVVPRGDARDLALQ